MSEVRPGYKQTEVGVIPEDWEAPSLGELFAFKNGLNKAKKYFGYGTPIINYMDVYKKPGLFCQDIYGRVSVNRAELDSYAVKKGDVFFTRTSETVEEVGIASVMLDELPDAVFSGFILRARSKDLRIVDQYKKYCFSSIMVRKQIIAKSTYTTRALTNGRVLSLVALPLPPTLAEQTAITEVLSDTDALIHGLDQLITKKRNIKQAAMQELLTGKRRLKGFGGSETGIQIGYKQNEAGVIPEDWISAEVSMLGQLKGGGTPSMAIKDYWENGVIPWVSSGDVKTQYIFSTTKMITEEAVKKSSTNLLPKGSILFVTRSGILRKYFPVGISMVSVAINQDIKALIPTDSFAAEYLMYALILCGPQILSTCMKSGTTVESIEYNWLKKHKIPLPPTLAEQTAIAAVLSDMDAEIAALEQKRDKYKAIKQGMMQELLTGKTRLV